MIGQYYLRNYFVARALQMLSLINENKQHSRKQNAILQVMSMWRSHIFATYPKVTWYHINLVGYINN